MPPQTFLGKIGRYEIKSELGRGGMATVFHAYDPRFRRDVAVKVLPREFLHDQTFLARFEREAHTIAALEHLAIVPVYDVGEEDGQPYLVMRLMTGGSLADRIAGATIPLEEAIGIIERVAAGLDEAHARGVVHRDLKPGNILFDKQGNPCLSDFGIVKLSETSTGLTSNAIIGTPAYMSPEQARGDLNIDKRADIYSLGVILFQLLTGRLPYTADTPMGLALKHITQPVPSILTTKPDLAPGVDTIIQRSLAKAPEDRYATAGEMASELAAIGGAGRGPRALRQEEAEVAPARSATDSSRLRETIRVTSPAPAGAVPTPVWSEARETLPAPTASAPTATLRRMPGWVWAAGGALLVGAVLVIFVGGVILTRLLSSGTPATPALTNEPAQTNVNSQPTAMPASTEGAPAQIATALPTDTPVSFAGPVPKEAEARLGKGTINKIALDSGGNSLAVGGGVGLYLYRLDNFAEQWVGLTSQPVSSVAFSPDGSSVAGGMADGTVIIWDVASGMQRSVLSKATGVITGVAWSPDGATLAAGSSGGTVTLWNASSGSVIATLQGHTDRVLSVAWSPDGARVASGSADNTVIVWDAAAKVRAHTLRSHTNWVCDVAWSPDGAKFVSAGFDGKIIIWDIESEEPVRTLEGHTGGVLSLAFAAKGDLLASSGSDGAVILWDVRTGQALRTIRGHTNWVVGVYWTPDETHLVTGALDGTVVVWDAASGERLRTLRGFTDWMTSLAYNPDGATLASGSADGTVMIWVTRGNELQAALTGHTDRVNDVAFSPDGSTLASASSDKTVILWSTVTGERLTTLRGFSSRVNSVAFDPDGTQIAAAGCGTVGAFGRCNQGVIVISEVSGGASKSLQGHTDTVWSVAWSPRSTRLASASNDGSVILWDPLSGEQLFTLTGHRGAVLCVEFSPDGRWLASGDSKGTVIVWDVETGRLLLTLVGHTDTVNGIAFSPDGARVATGSGDNQVILWSATTGERLRTFGGHGGGVNDVAFSPDGQRLASASSDGTILVRRP